MITPWTDRRSHDEEELAAKLGKNTKITTKRLGELVKEGSVVKTEEGNYRIATIAIKKLQEELNRN